MHFNLFLQMVQMIQTNILQIQVRALRSDISLPLTVWDEVFIWEIEAGFPIFDIQQNK